MNPAPRLARSRSGFSLMEVLLSSAILLGLLVLLLGATESGSRFWGRSERRRAALQEAGVSLQSIGHDLRSSVRTGDPATLLITPQSRGGDSLFLLVSHPEDHRPEGLAGDLCVTGYYTSGRPGHEEESDLYRFHACGQQVLSALKEGKLGELYHEAVPGKEGNEVLARHVAELEVTPVGESSSPVALRVTILAMDASTQRRLAAMTDPKAREELLKREGIRLGAIVTLPPLRETAAHP